MRPVITNDGWEHTISDIITLHDYEQDAQKLYEALADKDAIVGNRQAMSNKRYTFADNHSYTGQPVILSEFGGIAIEGKGEGWGYGTRVTDTEKLIARYDSLVMGIRRMPYICGFCYTQATDVQQEVNEFMDMERQFKCDAEAIKAINLRK